MKQTDSYFHNMYVRNFNFIWANSFLHEVLVVFGDRAQCEILSWGPKSPVAPLGLSDRGEHGAWGRSSNQAAWFEPVLAWCMLCA